MSSHDTFFYSRAYTKYQSLYIITLTCITHYKYQGKTVVMKLSQSKFDTYAKFLQRYNTQIIQNGKTDIENSESILEKSPE